MISKHYVYLVITALGIIGICISISELKNIPHTSRLKVKDTPYIKHTEMNETTSKHGMNETASKEGEQKRKSKIGVLIPTTSRGINISNIQSFTLANIAIKSLCNTMEPDYEYTIYIGIDIGDILLSYQQYLKGLHTRVVVVSVNGHTFTKAVNNIALKAVKDGMDYLVRINDDIKFVTKHWTNMSIATLQHNDPPNVGVVGPTFKTGNTNILIADFVHVTHYHIFGFYYPPLFDNWYGDDWITRVYRPTRSTKLTKWEVVHTQKFGRRYQVDMKQRAKLEQLIKSGNQTILEYVQGHRFHP